VNLYHSFKIPTLVNLRLGKLVCGSRIRATSHTRLRARDHYTSTTLIGGEGGVGPSSLHIVLEGPMEFVNARWM
jgi:hypothetical protein